MSSRGPELRPVERLEESETASLARDRGKRILRAGGTCRSILSRICHTRAGTSVRIAHKHAADVVHGNVVEIQQIATRVVASLIPDATALNRIGRRRIDCGPGLTGVVRERDVQMPDAAEVGRLRITRCLCAEECKR